jgi:hypothetical protein
MPLFYAQLSQRLWKSKNVSGIVSRSFLLVGLTGVAQAARIITRLPAKIRSSLLLKSKCFQVRMIFISGNLFDFHYRRAGELTIAQLLKRLASLFKREDLRIRRDRHLRSQPQEFLAIFAGQVSH